jgi:hypothetical protein
MATEKKNVFNFKEINVGVEDLWKGEVEGDVLIGYLRKYGKMNTKKGETAYIDISPVDANGQVILNDENEPARTTVFLSAGLANYPWSEWIGNAVKLEYTGEQENPRTGQTFKAYKVYVDSKN